MCCRRPFAPALLHILAVFEDARTHVILRALSQPPSRYAKQSEMMRRALPGRTCAASPGSCLRTGAACWKSRRLRRVRRAPLCRRAVPAYTHIQDPENDRNDTLQ